jgi:tripartite-type tricarboxylate transporter receptor subunit TctC
MTRQKPTFVAQYPSAAEQVLAVDAALWVGLFAPAGTPPAIVSRLNDAVAKILQDESVRKRLNDVGTEASHISEAAFAERIKVDAERYLKVIQQVGIKIQ